MRILPLLLVLAIAACNGTTAGSSTSAGPTERSTSSGSSTASSTGSSAGSATESSTGSSAGTTSGGTSSGAASSSGTTTGSLGNVIGVPCSGLDDTSCPSLAPTCVEGRIDGGYFCSVACTGNTFICDQVNSVGFSGDPYCDATGYCVIGCGMPGGGGSLGVCYTGQVCDNFACQPGTTPTVVPNTIGTLCTGPDDTSCPPSAPTCIEGNLDGGFFCSVACVSPVSLPCDVAGTVQNEGSALCATNNFCAAFCGPSPSGSYGTCTQGQFCSSGECLKSAATIGISCTNDAGACPASSSLCVETGQNTGDFICTLDCTTDADCRLVGSVAGTPYCDGTSQCQIACGGDAGTCLSGLVCVNGACQ